MKPYDHLEGCPQRGGEQLYCNFTGIRKKYAWKYANGSLGSTPICTCYTITGRMRIGHMHSDQIPYAGTAPFKGAQKTALLQMDYSKVEARVAAAFDKQFTPAPLAERFRKLAECADSDLWQHPGQYRDALNHAATKHEELIRSIRELSLMLNSAESPRGMIGGAADTYPYAKAETLETAKRILADEPPPKKGRCGHCAQPYISKDIVRGNYLLQRWARHGYSNAWHQEVMELFPEETNAKRRHADAQAQSRDNE